MDAETNAAALALLEAYYATPDDRPPGYWDALITDGDEAPVDSDA